MGDEELDLRIDGGTDDLILKSRRNRAVTNFEPVELATPRGVPPYVIQPTAEKKFLGRLPLLSSMELSIPSQSEGAIAACMKFWLEFIGEGSCWSQKVRCCALANLTQGLFA